MSRCGWGGGGRKSHVKGTLGGPVSVNCTGCLGRSVNGMCKGG